MEGPAGSARLTAHSLPSEQQPRRTPGRVSVYTPWAVLDFRKSDGQVPTPLCSSQDQMCMFGNKGGAGCLAWKSPDPPAA